MPFRDVIGHRRLVGLLQRAVARESLPPSLIFAGPQGVGKRLTAVAVAQTLNCTSRISPTTTAIDACGECAACSRIARAVHPDVLILEPGETGSIKIEPVRDAIGRSAYRPFEGRRRVVIVDDADALVAQAQNALLKTLEEPAAASVFVLITSRPDMLLPTVRSRCPQLRFGPLSIEELVTALERRGKPAEEARAVAAIADGSLGHALRANADDFVEARSIAERVLEQLAPVPGASERIDAARLLLTNTGSGVGDRGTVASYLMSAASLLRDAEAMAAGVDAGMLANSDVAPAIEQMSRAYRGERGVRAFEAIDRALLALDRNAGIKIVADWVALNL
jgi:DNA polymerase-3 subunit delta'